MARGRMIAKCLSTSEKYASLEQHAGKLAEFCQALFPLLVAHADDWGCLPGDVFTVKHLVHPTSPRKLQDFTAALGALDHVGLIQWYEAEDPNGGQSKRAVFIRGWYTHQQLKGHDQDGRKRQYGPPPEIPNKSIDVAQIRPNLPKSALREEKRTELKRREENLCTSADADFEQFREAYPASRRAGGTAAREAFKRAAAACSLDTMLTALAQHERSEQWHTPKLIPLMTTWLNQERWLQVLPEAHQTGPPTNARIAGLLKGGDAFLKATSGT